MNMRWRFTAKSNNQSEESPSSQSEAKKAVPSPTILGKKNIAPRGLGHTGRRIRARSLTDYFCRQGYKQLEVYESQSCRETETGSREHWNKCTLTLRSTTVFSGLRCVIIRVAMQKYRYMVAWPCDNRSPVWSLWHASSIQPSAISSRRWCSDRTFPWELTCITDS